MARTKWNEVGDCIVELRFQCAIQGFEPRLHRRVGVTSEGSASSLNASAIMNVVDDAHPSRQWTDNQAERMFGQFVRSRSLFKNVMVEAIRGTFKDGSLGLTASKIDRKTSGARVVPLDAMSNNRTAKQARQNGLDSARNGSREDEKSTRSVRDERLRA